MTKTEMDSIESLRARVTELEAASGAAAIELHYAVDELNKRGRFIAAYGQRIDALWKSIEAIRLLPALWIGEGAHGPATSPAKFALLGCANLLAEVLSKIEGDSSTWHSFKEQVYRADKQQSAEYPLARIQKLQHRIIQLEQENDLLAFDRRMTEAAQTPPITTWLPDNEVGRKADDFLAPYHRAMAALHIEREGRREAEGRLAEGRMMMRAGMQRIVNLMASLSGVVDAVASTLTDDSLDRFEGAVIGADKPEPETPTP